MNSQYPKMKEVETAGLEQLEYWDKHLPAPRTRKDRDVLRRANERLKEMGGPNAIESGAYHEAGHAVVATVLGFVVIQVGITDLEHEVCEYEIPEPTTLDSVRNEILLLLSGLAAQHKKHQKSCRRWHSGQDDERINALAEESGLDWRMLQDDAVDLVDKHWSVIERVAEQLLKSKRLSGDEVRQIVEAFKPRRGGTRAGFK
jgi:hypothetical protein